MVQRSHLAIKFYTGAACMVLAAGVGMGVPTAFAYGQDVAAPSADQITGVSTYTAGDDEEMPVVGVGSVITEGGTYQLQPYASNGELTVATTEPVTIAGSGLDTGKSDYFTIQCTVEGANLTLRDVKIDNATEYNRSAVRFTGAGNVLTIEGTNALQQCYNNAGDLAIV